MHYKIILCVFEIHTIMTILHQTKAPESPLLPLFVRGTVVIVEIKSVVKTQTWSGVALTAIAGIFLTKWMIVLA